MDAEYSRGQKQTACQIIVSRHADDEGSSNTVLWDSGKIKSPASVNNVYEGADLKVGSEILLESPGLG